MCCSRARDALSVCSGSSWYGVWFGGGFLTSAVVDIATRAMQLRDWLLFLAVNLREFLVNGLEGLEKKSCGSDSPRMVEDVIGRQEPGRPADFPNSWEEI